ncbi:unnamed protein product [Periconia digitata]|uniref:Uncharacterized protein n=1 Tax=Periconia digitata TaxID=1303443 RepID=A0A9W4XTL3_9PLEO|nr:unnamed protein product [Periconia digitata]
MAFNRIVGGGQRSSSRWDKRAWYSRSWKRELHTDDTLEENKNQNERCPRTALLFTTENVEERSIADLYSKGPNLLETIRLPPIPQIREHASELFLHPITLIPNKP